MDLREVSVMATDCIGEYGLTGWRFEFDNAKVRAGACHFRTKKITLSRHLMAGWSYEAVQNVILHEVAHAIVGPLHDHDAKWQRQARSMGCTGDRCWTPSEDAPPVASPWLLVCPNGHTSPRHRRTDRIKSCGKCSPRFDRRYVMEWQRNPVNA